MPASPDQSNAPLALTLGEPAGIGGEIALKAWALRRRENVPPFALLADPEHMAREAARFSDVLSLRSIDDPSEASALFGEALPILPCPLIKPVEPGRPSRANAPSVRAMIETAVHLVHQGRARAVVTNPIAKDVLAAEDFPFHGHTDFLGDLAVRICGADKPRAVMMLASPILRVVPVTVHMPLHQVPLSLTTDLIEKTGRITAAALRRDFGLETPRLAVSGLNPHAGENGLLGEEDDAVIAPAVRRLKDAGIDAWGPVPGDALFTPRARAGYDAALCMYHDQALIPLKALDFDNGVNVTLGLPFVRTSPDHGTAFDIAGTGTASPANLIAALKLAERMAAARAMSPPSPKGASA